MGVLGVVDTGGQGQGNHTVDCTGGRVVRGSTLDSMGGQAFLTAGNMKSMKGTKDMKGSESIGATTRQP